MIGPTGVGKTEIARRLAKLADAPFIKVEATKFTEVGYVGRDVEQIIRDLVESAITQTREKMRKEVQASAELAAENRVIEAIAGKDAREETRKSFRQRLRAGELDNKDIEIVNDISSSVECFNKINGADLIKNKIKIYIGTNINTDLFYQSLIWLFLIFLIPKKEDEKFKFTYLPIPFLIVFFYIHLLGEKKYYQSFSKDYKETLGIDNYYLLSLFISLILIFVLFVDINKTRFKNYINYFPFLFLVVGTYNSINLNT